MKIIVLESQLKQYVNELFSQKLVDNLIDRFRQENPDLKDNTINFYINRFQQIKDSPKVVEKDITQYTWEDLVNTIDMNQPEDIKLEFDDSGLIYDENNLKIYLANSQKSCVKYGTGYNFCISSRGKDNQYKGYRLTGGGTIYFVEDLDRSKDKYIGTDGTEDFEDPNHLLVIMAYDDPQHPYEITDANNEMAGLMTIRSWDQVTDLNPKLADLQNLFKPRDPDPKELTADELKTNAGRKISQLGNRHQKMMPGDSMEDEIGNGRQIVGVNDFEIKYVYNLINDIPVYKYLDKGILREIGFEEIDPKIWQDKYNKKLKPEQRGSLLVIKPTVEQVIPDEKYTVYLEKVWRVMKDYLHDKNKLNMPD